jgi:hypothetical protein
MNKKTSILVKFPMLLICTIPIMAFAQINSRNQDTTGKRDIFGFLQSLWHKNKVATTGKKEKKVYYSFFPVSSAVPGAGIALITTTTAGFYLGDQGNTSLSTIVFSPYITFTDRIGFAFRSNLWLKRDVWEVMGDTRFLYYPQYTWGLGGNTKDLHKIIVNYEYVRFYQTILRAIKPYFLAGLGYYSDAHLDIDTINDSASLSKFTGYSYGTSGNSFSSGISVNLLYDARRNAFNPFPGFYGNLVYRFNTRFLGSTDNWQSLYVDLRRYISFSRKQQNMIALWSFYWTDLGGSSPYLDLPSIGWDPYQQRSGRGFAQNRYRGNRMLYLECEYRRDIIPNGLLGFVIFSNVSSFSEPLSNQFSYLHPAAGCGIRIKLNRRLGTNISLDYGISRGYSALYLNLGETF